MVMKESIASGAKLVEVRRLECECFEGVLMDMILRSPLYTSQVTSRYTSNTIERVSGPGTIVHGRQGQTLCVQTR